MLNGAGMFNALMLSYARVPCALAKDGLLPRFLTRTTPASPTRAPVPWASILVCAVAWAMALGLSFERLISIDLVLYGASLMLEFVALAVLRVREPGLVRPFRIPGGLVVAVLTGVGPALLIAYALYAARGERVGPLPALDLPPWSQSPGRWLTCSPVSAQHVVRRNRRPRRLRREAYRPSTANAAISQ